MDDTHTVRKLYRVFIILDARMIYPHVRSVAGGVLPTTAHQVCYQLLFTLSGGTKEYRRQRMLIM